MVFCSQVCPFCSPSPWFEEQDSEKETIGFCELQPAAYRFSQSVHPNKNTQQGSVFEYTEKPFGKAEPPLDGIRFMYYSSP
jgi:hypothetical protein